MKLTGIAQIKLGGDLIRSQSGAKLMFGNAERNTIVGAKGADGYTEKPTAPGVECQISHSSDTSFKNLSETTDITITFECDTGTIYILRHGWLANSIEFSADENGVFDVTFNAMSCEEVR